MQFELAEALNKRVVILDDVMKDGWMTCIETMRSYFQSSIVTFNKKYGRMQEGQFPRTIITTNMSKAEVRGLYPDTADNRIMVETSLGRMKTSVTMHPVSAKCKGITPLEAEWMLYNMFKYMFTQLFEDHASLEIADFEKFFENNSHVYILVSNHSPLF